MVRTSPSSPVEGWVVFFEFIGRLTERPRLGYTSGMTALERRLSENREGLLRFVRSRVGNEALAEDILQESLLKALSSGDQLREEDKLIPWFYRILRNAITDAHRRLPVRDRALEGYGREVDREQPAPDEVTVLCRCFEALLPTLKPEYASLIEAIDLGGASVQETAEALDITPNNLKVRHHRARRQLRERLEQTCRVCAEHGCLDCTCRPAG